MRRTASVTLLALLVLTGCRTDQIELEYRYAQGVVTNYLMTADAEATWNIGGPGRGSCTGTFEVTEEVMESFDTGEAVVEVAISPREVEENGLPCPGAEERSFSLRLGKTGEVLEVLEVNDVAASSLNQDELALIGTYRPDLALRPIALKDEWRSEQQIEIGAAFQQIVTIATLDRLDEDAAGKTAEFSYSGSGPVVGTTALPEGAAELVGDTRVTGSALLDLDGGFLREASSSTEGEFEVRAVPVQGSTPITGVLDLKLELTLERL